MGFHRRRRSLRRRRRCRRSKFVAKDRVRCDRIRVCALNRLTRVSTGTRVDGRVAAKRTRVGRGRCTSRAQSNNVSVASFLTTPWSNACVPTTACFGHRFVLETRRNRRVFGRCPVEFALFSYWFVERGPKPKIRYRATYIEGVTTRRQATRPQPFRTEFFPCGRYRRSPKFSVACRKFLSKFTL